MHGEIFLKILHCFG